MKKKKRKDAQEDERRKPFLFYKKKSRCYVKVDMMDKWKQEKPREPACIQ
jgi:hypothetical protein